MATIDLTLDSFIVPRMSSFTPPWGSVQDDPDHPGLSTQELINNIMMAFNRKRPFIVTEDSTTTDVQADTSLVLRGDINSLTLGQGAYKNVELTIENGAADNVVLLNGSMTITCALGDTLELRWNGTEWRAKTDKHVGDFIQQIPSEKSPVEKCLEGKWVDWSGRAVLYGLSAAAPPSYVDYYSLAGSSIAANTTPVVCYHQPGSDYRLYKFKSSTAAYTVPAELDPVKWDYLTPDIIDVRESCQKLSFRNPSTQEITVTGDLQIGDSIADGVHAGKYVTEIIVPGGKFLGIEGGFRPTFISGGVQEDRIREISGYFGIETYNNNQSVYNNHLQGVFEKFDPGIGEFGDFTNISKDHGVNIRFRASLVVKTGPDNAPANLSARFWRRVPDPA
jgi:hypothetical protein